MNNTRLCRSYLSSAYKGSATPKEFGSTSPQLCRVRKPKLHRKIFSSQAGCPVHELAFFVGKNSDVSPINWRFRPSESKAVICFESFAPERLYQTHRASKPALRAPREFQIVYEFLKLKIRPQKPSKKTRPESLRLQTKLL